MRDDDIQDLDDGFDESVFAEVMQEDSVPPLVALVQPAEKKRRPRKVKSVAAAPDARQLTDPESALRSLRMIVSAFYDAQEYRKQIANRVTPKKNATIILAPADIERNARMLVDAKFVEKQCARMVLQVLREIPAYNAVFKEFPAIGLASSAMILSQVDIRRADTVSKIWAFAGLNPVPCQRCTGCNRVLLKGDDRLYRHRPEKKRDKSGKVISIEMPNCRFAKDTLDEVDTKPGKCRSHPVKGQKRSYCASLRACLIGGVGTAIIKSNIQPYRKQYDDVKHRLTSANWGVSPLHRHNSARSCAVKLLLRDLHEAWRKFEGLPVRPSYQEEKLGHVHGGGSDASAHEQ